MAGPPARPWISSATCRRPEMEPAYLSRLSSRVQVATSAAPPRRPAFRSRAVSRRRVQQGKRAWVVAATPSATLGTDPARVARPASHSDTVAPERSAFALANAFRLGTSALTCALTSAGTSTEIAAQASVSQATETLGCATSLRWHRPQRTEHSLQRTEHSPQRTERRPRRPLRSRERPEHRRERSEHRRERPLPPRERTKHRRKRPEHRRERPLPAPFRPLRPMFTALRPSV